MASAAEPNFFRGGFFFVPKSEPRFLTNIFLMYERAGTVYTFLKNMSTTIEA